MSPEELARIECVLGYELGFQMGPRRPPPAPPVPPKPKAKKPPVLPKHNKFVSKDMIPFLPIPLMPARPPPPPPIPRYIRDYTVLDTPIHLDKAKAFNTDGLEDTNHQGSTLPGPRNGSAPRERSVHPAPGLDD